MFQRGWLAQGKGGPTHTYTLLCENVLYTYLCANVHMFMLSIRSPCVLLRPLLLPSPLPLLPPEGRRDSIMGARDMRGRHDGIMGAPGGSGTAYLRLTLIPVIPLYPLTPEAAQLTQP